MVLPADRAGRLINHIDQAPRLLRHNPPFLRGTGPHRGLRACGNSVSEASDLVACFDNFGTVEALAYSEVPTQIQRSANDVTSLASLASLGAIVCGLDLPIHHQW